MKSSEILSLIKSVLWFSGETFDRIQDDLDYGSNLTYSQESQVRALCCDPRELPEVCLRETTQIVIEILDGVRIHLGDGDIAFCVSMIAGDQDYKFYTTHRAYKEFSDGITTYVDEDIYSCVVGGDSPLDQIEQKIQECVVKLNDSIRSNFSPQSLRDLHQGVWERQSQIINP